MPEMQDRIMQIEKLTERLKEQYPAEINSFLSFMGKAEGSPALSKTQKELINVGLAVAAQCEWCIALHVHGAVKAGASRDEIMSAGDGPQFLEFETYRMAAKIPFMSGGQFPMGLTVRMNAILEAASIPDTQQTLQAAKNLVRAQGVPA